MAVDDPGAEPSARQAAFAKLFGRSGIRLGFLRVPMGASDFSAHGVPYTYDDVPAGHKDPTLAHFSIAHDRAYIIPALRQARALNPSLRLLANPWSPPAWMKANDRLDNEGHTGQVLRLRVPGASAVLRQVPEVLRRRRGPGQCDHATE